jgi:hypothetical protein
VISYATKSVLAASNSTFSPFNFDMKILIKLSLFLQKIKLSLGTSFLNHM